MLGGGLPERVLVALEPLHEFADAVAKAPVGLVAAFGFELGRVGVRLVDVARLHGQEVLLGRFAVGFFDFLDEVHELYGVAATDIVDLVGHVVRALGRVGYVVQRVDGSLGDVVDVGEVADHVAVVEHLDGFALRDRAREEHGGHVGASPGAVDGEEPETCDRQVVEFAVAVGHELVAFLGRGVKAHGIVDLVVFAVGHLAVEAVHGAGRGEHQVLDLVMAAGFQDVQESDQVALQVGVRVRDGVAHAGLGGEVRDLVEFFFGEKLVEAILVFEGHFHESAVPVLGTLHHRSVGEVVARLLDAAFAESAVLEPHIIIVVDVVEAHDFVAAFREHEHELRSDKTGCTCN